jgi:cobalamin biosynthetic protein CobC
LLEHGGKLVEAAKKHDIALKHWIDLSTGLNPVAWPADRLDQNQLLQSWSQLPQDDDGLAQAALDYYGGQHVLPVAGSQAAIQALPHLWSRSSKVAVLTPAFEEHRYAWQEAGFDVTSFGAEQTEDVINHHDVVVLVNPCNPTGQRFDKRQCLSWHKKLKQRGGWLIVDEAFMDVTPGRSLASHATDGLITLHSLGKFFGLAGARVGFVFAAPPLLAALANELGPWPIATPSRLIARKALEDGYFQRRSRQYLRRQGDRLAELLTSKGLPPDGSTALFCWVQTPQAPNIHKQLAKQAILTRLFSEPQGLRFGLPGEEKHWQRLERALACLNRSVEAGS